jgi:hypothetical protein
MTSDDSLTAVSEPAPVRICSLADLVAAVPVLVGYAPAESLVLVAMRGPRRDVGLTACLPLPRAAPEEPVAPALLRPLRESGAVACVLVVYTEEPGDGVGSATVEALRDELRGAGIDVLDALLVRGGRWRSYDCDDWSCCGPDGTPVPGVPAQLAVASAARGRAVLPGRDALVASVAPVAGLRATRMRERIRNARATQVARGVDRSAALAMIRCCVEDVAETGGWRRATRPSSSWRATTCSCAMRCLPGWRIRTAVGCWRSSSS